LDAGAARGRLPPFKFGNRGGALDSTDAFGNITIRAGLSGKDLLLTLRHEAVHRFFSPKTPGLLQGVRARLGMWGYNNSHMLRFIEETIAETYATGSLSAGLRLSLDPASGISLGRVTAEAGLYLGVVGGGAAAVAQ
jgi:hypothetical protein